MDKKQRNGKKVKNASTPERKERKASPFTVSEAVVSNLENL